MLPFVIPSFSTSSQSFAAHSGSATNFKNMSVLDPVPLRDKFGREMIRFHGLSNSGFVVNLFNIHGPVFALTNGVYLWTPPLDESKIPKQLSKSTLPLSIQDFALAQFVDPKPEILVIGTGKYTMQIDQTLIKDLDELGLKYEISSTTSAIGSFNILASEGRNICGAFMPKDFVYKPPSVTNNNELPKIRRPNIKIPHMDVFS